MMLLGLESRLTDLFSTCKVFHIELPGRYFQKAKDLPRFTCSVVMLHNMRKRILCCLTIVMLLAFAPVFGVDGSAENLIFPEQSATSYVKLIPIKGMNLNAFTLCVRAFTDLNRAYSLFSYAAANSNNELLLYAISRFSYDVNIGSKAIRFQISSAKDGWNHICVTWESKTGLVGLWVNGIPSVRKGLLKSYTIKADGVVVLGQEQDSVEGSFNVAESFVGEINDVNLWDHILSSKEIRAIYNQVEVAHGNVIDWHTVKYTLAGYVVVEKIQQYSNNQNN
ncbi:mucosal pentraxin-like [Protopterus annectens]|uniref:mucosal pentraxin-like n=1 Tax=Protopterus annectens TaxID=7888 RepID=UPI001CFC436E|nr:mucosal pentraxin-like [Protopterus annectens]